MQEDAYRKIEAVSQSMLKELLASPRRFEAAYITQTLSRETTPAMEFGTMVHKIVLQPSVAASTIVMIPDDVLTSNGQRRGKAWDQFCMDNAGKQLVRRDEYDKAFEIAKKVWSHPFYELAFDWMRYTENPITWEDADTGVQCKGIPDVVCDNEWVIDLKTTADLTGFVQGAESYTSKTVADFGYHMQAAFYLRGTTIHYGEPKTRFAFIVVETKAPYRVYAMELNAAAITAGEVKVQRALAEYKRRMETNDWSEEGERALLQVGIPAWAI